MTSDRAKKNDSVSNLIEGDRRLTKEIIANTPDNSHNCALTFYLKIKAEQTFDLLGTSFVASRFAADRTKAFNRHFKQMRSKSRGLSEVNCN